MLKSSNLSFFEAVWDAVKSSTGVTALEKRITAVDVLDRQNSNITVDIVAQGGLEWVKVSTITERTLLFDMAKAGWTEDSSSDGEDDVTGNYVHDSKPDGLMKHIKSYLEVSQTVRIRYRHPQIRIVLPNISRYCGAKEIGNFILQVEALGVTVQTSDDIKESPELESVLPRLVFDPFLTFSETINVDCTILLALVSDLSHERVEVQDWHHPAILRQIEVERDRQLLPTILWPACGSRPMVCTREAAEMMHEIINMMGTETEKQRTKLLLQEEGKWSRDYRLKGFQELSSYEVPSTWNLPIKIVEADLATLRQHLPPISLHVAKHLSPLNESVFFYGWTQDMTTITSNREVTNKITASIEQNRELEIDTGPDIWVCQTSRSLVGKEKSRR